MAVSDWIPKRSDFKPSWFRPGNFRRVIVRLFFIGVFLVFVAGLLGLVLQILDINVVYPEQVLITELLSSVFPLILSGLLVYLYYQQKQILMKDHRSKLSVNRFIDADGEDIKLKITNSGDGAAHGVFLNAKLDFNDGEVEGGETFLELKTEEEDDSRRFVKPFESGSIFEKTVLLKMHLPGESTPRIPQFGMAMSLAQRYDVTRGHLQLDLVWEDSVQSGRETIFDKDIDVADYDSFEVFISQYPEYVGNKELKFE